MIKAIVCVDKNWGIGRDNGLLFNLPNDLRAFRVATIGKVVICGRKTLESFPSGKPLAARSTICLCSKENYRDDCFCIDDINELRKLIKELAKAQDVFIIGGGSVYKELLDCCDEVIVTKVQANGHATVFFPNLDELDTFELAHKSEDIYDNEYLTNICVYERISYND
jgi:dihydrofolate reductase